jgi:transposase
MGRSKTRKAKEAKAVPTSVQEVEAATLQGYLDKVERGEPLTAEELQSLRATVATTAYLTAEIKRKRVSLQRLRDWLFGAPTEKTATVCPPPEPEAGPAESETGGQASVPSKADKPKRKGHGRNPASCYRGAEQVKVAHPHLSAGDSCPECPRGKVYPMAEPATLVRVVGLAPLSAKVVELERFRCNCCDEVFKAPAPEGIGNDKYDETASSMVGALRYGLGTPFYRLEKFQGGMGVPLPVGTQWKLVKHGAGLLEPAFDHLITWVAQSDVIHNDDTVMKVLDRPDLQRKGKARKGVYTSGIIGKQGSHRIALFLTGMNHSGENLAEVLRRRREELARPIQMCDALNANTAGDLDTIVAHCMVHARRKFVEVAEDFPEECRFLLECLKEVYAFEAATKDMTPQERLDFHKEHSGPVMDQIWAWIRKLKDGKEVEPSSGLGDAIDYMEKHWQRLTLFLREPGCPIDNNAAERILKRAILHRKNSLFYKTLTGARVGDVFMSLIHSAELSKVNPFDYLVALQRYHVLVEENPEEWMPWNYAATLAGLGLAE